MGLVESSLRLWWNYVGSFVQGWIQQFFVCGGGALERIGKNYLRSRRRRRKLWIFFMLLGIYWKIGKQVWTNWAKINPLKLLFWQGDRVVGWLHSNINLTKSVNWFWQNSWKNWWGRGWAPLPLNPSLRLLAFYACLSIWYLRSKIILRFS